MLGGTLSGEFAKGESVKRKRDVRRCLCMCMMLVLCHISFSQDSVNLPADEKAIWNDPNAPEAARLDDLVDRALLLLEKAEYHNSYKYVDRILDFELGRTSPKYQSYSILSEGFKMSYRDSNKLKKFQESIDLATSVDYKTGMSLGHTFAGIYHRHQGNDEKAFEHWKTSIKLSDDTDDYHLNINNGWTEIQVAMMMIRKGNTKEADNYTKEAFRTFWAIPDKPAVYYGYYELGMAYKQTKQYPKALEYFHKALPLMPAGNPFIHLEMANIYEAQGEWTKALKYYEYCRKQYNAMNRPDLEYLAMSDLGRMLVKLGELDQATKVAEELVLDADSEKPLAPPFRTYTLLGDIALAQDKATLAIKQYQTSLRLYKEKGFQDSSWISYNHLVQSMAYLKQKNYSKAIEHCLKCKSFFENNKDFVEQEAVYETLYTAYKNAGNFSMALEYLEKIIELKKDKNPLETARQLQEFEYSKKVFADSLKQVEEKLKTQIVYETELRQKEQSRNLAIGIGIIFILLAGGFYSRWNYVRKSRDEIAKEKDRSELLLLNILPAEIAEELKENGRSDARDFEVASILFTDFKEFTQTSEKLSAKELVEEINICFEAFDKICEQYQIEKIKTIGDSYMAAGGLPVPSAYSVKNTLLAGIRMQEFMQEHNTRRKSERKIPFEMRLGIHTGPVVAGIVGVKKFQYDIWGDSVNIASRMESNSAVGKVNISQATYDLLKLDADFDFESRGKIEVKGKGEMAMYFAERKSSLPIRYP